MKVLLTNRSALQSKYGAGGLKKVIAATSELIAADKNRGITTRLIDLSDPTTMKKYKGTAVTKPVSGKQNKDAVDAVYGALKPDYLVILGGPDIVAHLDLSNPVPDDDDPNIPSDLPYASDAPFTKRDPAHYAAATRVVGRIPGVYLSDDPTNLIKQLKNSARSKPRPRNYYLKYFAISNTLWQDSTKLSLGTIFNSAKVKLCPPSGRPDVNKLLSAPMQFINCHGAQAADEFYGETKTGYPVAFDGGGVTKNSKLDAVIAAECCYGAELYDPTLADGKLPISNCYLANGAIGYFGSTNIAYGPEDTNGAADLITQYFLIDVLAGASLGRAGLQARQKFVQGEKMEDPVNLKTLAQFILLGDPALQACKSEEPKDKGIKKDLDEAGARTTRRIELTALGKAIADGSAFPGKQVRRPGKNLTRTLMSIARKKGFRSKAVTTYDVTGGPTYRTAAKGRDGTAKVLVITDPTKKRGKAAAKRPQGVPEVRVLVAHTRDGRIVGTTEYISR